MKPLVTGIHHISMSCRKGEEYDRVVTFYRDVLGLAVVRTWGGEQPEGIMLDTGSGIIEIFTNADSTKDEGIIAHFALATDDTDACVQRVREAGYEVFTQPTDITIPSNPPLDARIAFCYGPLGEKIEFFHVK